MATINDIVLIYLEDSPVSFARIESILPDAKKDWYHIKFLMLQIPLQVVTWILKDEYLNGDEFFMNGKQMKLKKVECPIQELSPSIPATLSRKTNKKAAKPKKKQSSKENESESIENSETQDAGKTQNTEKKHNTGKIISFADLKNKDKKK
jgi:hypothetical protein